MLSAPPAAPAKHREGCDMANKREQLLDIIQVAAEAKSKEDLHADYATLKAENKRQASDIDEFMRRLGPRWFLEQGWFPESVETSDGL